MPGFQHVSARPFAQAVESLAVLAMRPSGRHLRSRISYGALARRSRALEPRIVPPALRSLHEIARSALATWPIARAFEARVTARSRRCRFESPEAHPAQLLLFTAERCFEPLRQWSLARSLSPRRAANLAQEANRGREIAAAPGRSRAQQEKHRPVTCCSAGRARRAPSKPTDSARIWPLSDTSPPRARLVERPAPALASASNARARYHSVRPSHGDFLVFE